nr:MAG TPA: helix-turn-helix domain protein [Caudoviricetes sp.]
MIELMTAEDVAKIFQVDKSTVRSWVSRNKFPEQVLFKMPGGKASCTRFIKPRLEDWINGCLQT